MAFTLETPAEAYAAVTLLVVGADGVGTMEERDFLFGELGSLDVFAGHGAESFGAMLGAMTGRIVSGLSNDGTALDTDAVQHLCTSARAVLDASQCHELFSSAVKLAYSDGLANAERAVLGQIAEGLGIDATTAQDLISRSGRA